MGGGGGGTNIAADGGVVMVGGVAVGAMGGMGWDLGGGVVDAVEGGTSTWPR